MAKTKEQIRKECLENISKQYPQSTFGIYSEMKGKSGSDFLKTGSISADYVLGGGLARMSCLVGFPSSGKTTLALSAIALMQKQDPDAFILYCDAEYALDMNYANALGVDVSKLILLQPDSAEEGYGIIEAFVESGIADLVVIDSVAAMVPKEITEGEYGDSVQIGRMAVLTTKAVQRLNRLSGIHKTKIIWINQYKKNVQAGRYEVATTNQMGTSFYIPGGQNFPFFMQQIIQISKSGTLNVGKKAVSNVIKVKTIKNKVGVPYREGETIITFGKGIDKYAEIVSLGLTFGLIISKGAFCSFSEEVGCNQRVNGRIKLSSFLVENPDVCNRLEKLLEEKINSLKDDGVNNKVLISKDKGGASSSDDSDDDAEDATEDTEETNEGSQE